MFDKPDQRGRAPPLFGSHSRRSANRRGVLGLRRLTVAVAAAIIVSALVWWILWSTGRVGEPTHYYDAIIVGVVVVVVVSPVLACRKLLIALLGSTHVGLHPS